MLQRFGEHIRGWFAGIVVGVIALAFIAWGLESYVSSDRGPDAVVATANGIKINEQTFEQDVQAAQSKQGQTLGRALTSKERQLLKSMVLSQLIQQAIIIKQFQKMGLQVPSAAIQQVIETAPDFQENGRFSSQRLQAYLTATGQSIDMLAASIQRKVMMAQLTGGIGGSAFITPSSLASLFGLWQAQRDFRYAVLPLGDATKINVTPKQIQAYYNNHKADYAVPAKVQVQYVLLSRDSLDKTGQPTIAEAKAYYAQHPENFKTAMRWKISRITTNNEKSMQALQQRLKSGETFQALVKKPRKDWQVVTQTLDAAETAPALIAVLKNLPVGSVSQSLSTPAGPTIMQLLAKQPATTKPFSTVKAQILLQLSAQHIQQKLSQLNQQVTNLAYTHPHTLAPIARKTGLSLQQSGLFSRNNAAGIFKQPPVLDAIFSPSVLKDGNNSQPIALKDGTMIVLRIIKHVPGVDQPLSAVKKDVVQALQHNMALRQLGLKAYDIQNSLNRGQVQKELVWKTVQHAKRMNKNIDPKILSQAFQTAKGQVGVIQNKQGYVLIQTQKIALADWSSATVKQKKSFKSMLMQWQGRVDMNLYFKSLFKQAKVVIKHKKLASSWSL